METDTKDEPQPTGSIRDSLGRFKPGFSGHPGGRGPQKLSLVKLIKKKLEEIPEGEDTKTYAEMIIENLLEQAYKDKDFKAIVELIDRVDGKATQSVQLAAEITNNQIDLSKLTDDELAVLNKLSLANPDTTGDPEAEA